MIERIALLLLALIAIISGYALSVAASRFGNATETFDAIQFDLESFDYQRGDDTVEFSIRVTNPAMNDVLVTYVEYSFVINGVLSGGGDERPGIIIPPGESALLQLQGRITDMNYVNRIDPDETISWLVNARIQISVDERMDAVFIPFFFRTETP